MSTVKRRQSAGLVTKVGISRNERRHNFSHGSLTGSGLLIFVTSWRVTATMRRFRVEIRRDDARAAWLGAGYFDAAEGYPVRRGRPR